MTSRLWLSIAAVALVASGGAASARGLSASAKGPVDIAADEAEVQNKACISTWKGNAEALQGDTRLRANLMRAYFEAKAGADQPAAGAAPSTGNCGALLKLEAEGAVYYVTPEQRLRGDAATYDASAETVVVTGDVIAVQGQNVLRGTRMVFNTRTGEGHMVGSATGRNQANRPRGVFYPKEDDTPAAGASPAGTAPK
jgi:lipopolysaccharide export system protein LptA